MPAPLAPPATPWDFICWLYQQPKVQDSVLELQDTHTADVSLLLFCCWYGYHHGTLNDLQWEKLLLCSHNWQSQVLQPLRGARRWLKQQADKTTYYSIKDLELNCEQSLLQELTLLAKSNSLKNTPVEPESACQQNIARYLLGALKINEDIAETIIVRLTTPLAKPR